MSTQARAEPEYRRFLAPDSKCLNDDERKIIRSISEEVLCTDQIEATLKFIDDIVDKNSSRSEPRSGIVVGDAGTGKTTTIEILKDRFPEITDEFHFGYQRRQPLLAVSLPANITQKSMAQTLLQTLGHYANLSGNTKQLTDRLCENIKACEVETIIIDELQHLHGLGNVSRDSASASLRAARNWIKDLVNRLPSVSVILMGVPETLMLIDGESQLERRFTEVHEIKPFAPPQTGCNEFASFVDCLVDAVIKHSGIIKSAEHVFGNSDWAARLYATTVGNPSRTKDAVTDAALYAYRDGRDHILLTDFPAAFAIRRQSRTRLEAIQQRRDESDTVLRSVNSGDIDPFTATDDEVNNLIMPLAA